MTARRMAVGLIGLALAATACGAAVAAPVTIPTTASSVTVTIPARTTTTKSPPTTTRASDGTAKAYAYYRTNVISQHVGVPDTLAQATPLIAMTCRLLATESPSAAFNAVGNAPQPDHDTQVGSAINLYTIPQDVILSAAAAKYACPSRWAAVDHYLGTISN